MTTLYLILVGTGAFVGLVCVVCGIVAFFKIPAHPNPGEDEFTLFGVITIKSRRGAGLLLLVGLVLFLLCVMSLQTEMDRQRLRSRTSTLEEQLRVLGKSQAVLTHEQRQIEQLRTDLSSLLRTSEQLPADVQRRVASSVQKGLEPAATRDDVARLQAQMEKLRSQQAELAQKQEIVLGNVTQTASRLDEQSEHIRFLQERLRKVDIQTQVAEVVEEALIGQALPTEFRPVRWEMVEVRGSKPRRFELRAESPLIESQKYLIRPEFEGNNTLVLTAAAEDEETKTRIEQAIPVERIRSQVEAAGFRFKTNFFVRKR